MSIHPVISGANSLQQLNDYLSQSIFSSVIILADSNTNLHCVPLLADKINNFHDIKVVVVPAGEKNKSLDSLNTIIRELLSVNADRKALLVNTGGGMITDLGGFVASVYKRGIKFINIPTSLLAMTDASIGGKTGINAHEIKNVIGTFSLPESVFIHTGFLQTLPERELKSAFAEICKHILLSDAGLWKKLVSNTVSFFSNENIPSLIDHSVSFKLKVVNEDLHETGRRHVLNMGHTLGHAIESCMLNSSRSLLHGEAIAAGLIGELFLSTKYAGLEYAVVDEALKAVHILYPTLTLDFRSESLFPYLVADKKNSSNSIAFSLLEAPGRASKLTFVSNESIDESIQFIINAFIDKNQLVNDKH